MEKTNEEITNVTTQALITSGLALVAIPYGQKGPVTSGWNLLQNCITDSSKAAQLQGGNIGLAHAYCTPTPTCAIDIDNYKLAKAWLETHGIDLEALLLTVSAVVIWSGKKNSLKLIYKLPLGTKPMVSTKIDGADGRVVLELRCATKDGKTVQDVLPPSVHPSGSEYRWMGHGNPLLLPEIPRELLAVWHRLITNVRRDVQHRIKSPTAQHPQPETPRQIATLQSALATISADCDYDKWRNVVWAILSTGWVCAEDLAIAWSKTAPDRFDDDTFWVLANSFIFDHSRQISVGTIYHHARLGGWNG